LRLGDARLQSCAGPEVSFLVLPRARDADDLSTHWMPLRKISRGHALVRLFSIIPMKLMQCLTGSELYHSGVPTPAEHSDLHIHWISAMYYAET
jgi:hypothetical protein